MRKKRDAAGTKEEVLASAEKMFSEKGFNGTSIADISRTSGISDGLILYHFGSKEKLYREVVERVSARYAGLFSNRNQPHAEPAGLLADMLRAVFDFWKNDEHYHRISLWSYLERREGASSRETQLTAGLAAYLRSLQTTGRFAASIDPVVFLSEIIGPIHFWFRYRQHFADILGLSGTADELDERFIEQHIGMLSSFFPPME